MPMDLNDIVVFIKVVELGSFTRAAQNLGFPKSTVSTKVSQLERRLGVSLIHRTTRKISLTEIGKQFYDRCAQNIQNLKNAEEEITFSKTSPSGKIRVSAPIFLGSYFLPSIIAEFRKNFEKVEIELLLTDRSVDLIAESVDLVIRAGRLQDSSLISKKIGSTYFSLYASPSYLKKNEKILHPKDLRHHRCIQFTPLGKEKWIFTHPDLNQTVTVPLNGEYLVDDLSAIKKMIQLHLGIGLLPVFSCKDEVESKDLVAVLPGWRTEIQPIHFVYPNRQFLLPKIKQFMICAEKIMRESMS